MRREKEVLLSFFRATFATLRPNIKREVTALDLRLAAAAMLFWAGVDLNEIRALLRHTRIGITADIYIDVLDDIRRGTARSMDDILTRLRDPATATESEADRGAA